MLSYNNDHCTYDDNSADLTANSPQPQTSATTAVATATLPPHPLYLPPLVMPEHDILLALRSELGYTSSGCISSHSLHNNLDVYSRLANSPPANENSILLESMNRASPYSSEEKKERIERYRSKRNLRNFNKKIKYECRKTLADSRPRIRGRFVRNDETEKTTRSQWDHRAGDEEAEEEDNWRNFLDSFHAHLMP